MLKSVSFVDVRSLPMQCFLRATRRSPKGWQSSFYAPCTTCSGQRPRRVYLMLKMPFILESLLPITRPTQIKGRPPEFDRLLLQRSLACRIPVIPNRANLRNEGQVVLNAPHLLGLDTLTDYNIATFFTNHNKERPRTNLRSKTESGPILKTGRRGLRFIPRLVQRGARHSESVMLAGRLFKQSVCSGTEARRNPDLKVL